MQELSIIKSICTIEQKICETLFCMCTLAQKYMEFNTHMLHRLWESFWPNETWRVNEYNEKYSNWGCGSKTCTKINVHLL